MEKGNEILLQRSQAHYDDVKSRFEAISRGEEVSADQDPPSTMKTLSDANGGTEQDVNMDDNGMTEDSTGKDLDGDSVMQS